MDTLRQPTTIRLTLERLLGLGWWLVLALSGLASFVYWLAR